MREIVEEITEFRLLDVAHDADDVLARLPEGYAGVMLVAVPSPGRATRDLLAMLRER